jgi:tetratricopeptide (TPR) repeat protein
MYTLSCCRWLLVVCTNEDQNALGIRQAINYFAASKGKEFILPLLFRGEPESAFPPEFFEKRKNIITFNDGTTKEIIEVVEPLAVDVRASDIKTSLVLLSQVRIKIVAALIGVSYDTLVQRHEKRARQRLKVIASIIILLPVLFGSFFTYLWFNSKHKTDIAIQKTQLSKDLLADMCLNYPMLFQDTPEVQPYVNSLLVNSLEKLRIAESDYIPLLPVDELLLPEADDDLNQLRNKAKILRYLGKKEEALDAYKKAALMLQQGSELYSSVSVIFTKNTDPNEYPSGILVVEIEDEVSQKCDGLSTGDIIVETGGFKFRDIGQYEFYLKNNVQDDKSTKLTILRPENSELSRITLSVKPKNLVFIAEEM